MTYSVSFLPDVALADIAYRIKADSLEELFHGAVLALTGVMVEPDGLRADTTLEVEVQGDDTAELLHELLSHIVYLKDAQSFLPSDLDVHLEGDPPIRLQAVMRGDTIDPSRHRLGQDVKAITYHLFDVGREGRHHYAQIVLDV